MLNEKQHNLAKKDNLPSFSPLNNNLSRKCCFLFGFKQRGSLSVVQQASELFISCHCRCKHPSSCACSQQERIRQGVYTKTSGPQHWDTQSCYSTATVGFSYGRLLRNPIINFSRWVWLHVLMSVLATCFISHNEASLEPFAGVKVPECKRFTKWVK